MTDTEIWKPVPLPGYSEQYAISSLGRVKRITKAARGPAQSGDLVRVRIMKSGHHQVSLSHRAQSVYPLVHRLVLAAFVGPCPEGQECCHNDGNPSNNRLDNLRWDTRLNNVGDAFEHGTFALGSRRGQAKLTEDGVREIRKIVANGGATQRELAKRYGVSEIVVSFAVNRKTWKHVA